MVLYSSSRKILCTCSQPMIYLCLARTRMAATLHAKINRKNLDKLNIIKICEEILNLSVPMALRLSGILMGGVVIVYERKVKLLYEDVNRLLVEINEAWKVTAAPSDSTRLPKNKSQAKYEAVTLPKSRVEDLGEMEQSLPYSNRSIFLGFQQRSYVAMRLDSVDDTNLNQNTQVPLNHDQHQADAANITLLDEFDPYQADTNAFNRFERFDIEGDEDFTAPEHIDIPGSLISSPPPPEDPQEPQKPDDEILEQHPEEQVKQQSYESKDANQVRMKERPAQRPRRRAAVAMDDNQNFIPGQVYQTWLRDSSDIISKRGRKRKMQPQDTLSTLKMATLLDLPSIVCFEKLFTSNMQIYYPEPLLGDWMKMTQPPHDSPSGRNYSPHPPEPSLSFPPEAMHFMGPVQDPFNDFHNRLGPQSPRFSVEKQRTEVYNNEQQGILMEELMNNLKNSGLSLKETSGVSASKSNLLATPANSGDDIRSIPSSDSGKGFPSINLNVNSGRSSRKRPYSASKTSGNGLEPVAEEHSWEHPDPNFKIARLSGQGLTLNDEVLVETGPTQTQKNQTVNQLDRITDSIRMHLKSHFDASGSAKGESLLHLAYGMDKKRAASLFYQTCVLATHNYIKVDQKVPYGDILISRGANM